MLLAEQRIYEQEGVLWQEIDVSELMTQPVCNAISEIVFWDGKWLTQKFSQQFPSSLFVHQLIEIPSSTHFSGASTSVVAHRR